MPNRSRSPLDAWLPALLLIAGTLAFLGGGRQHPQVNSSTMPSGSAEEYLRHFADMILSMPTWEPVHTLILFGPVLWALGAAASVRLLPSRAAVLGEVGRTALLAGAGLWALAFVLDGYAGPRYAQAVMAAGTGNDAAAIASFGANAFLMARIGMVSVVLIAVAPISLGVALLFESRVRSWRAAVGVLGVLVGAWPMIATLQGEFYPAPFTSVHWTTTAISLGAWFLLFGTALPGLLSSNQAVSLHKPVDLVAGEPAHS